MITHLVVQLGATGKGEISEFYCRILKRRGMRRLVLRVTGPYQITVTAPWTCSKDEVGRFVQAQSDWIQSRHDELIGRLGREGSLVRYLSDQPVLRGAEWSVPVELVSSLRGKLGPVVEGKSVTLEYCSGAPEISIKEVLVRYATHFLPRRVEYFLRRMSVSIASVQVSVRDQRRRWGSCSSRHTISLNWRLILLPADLRDYVIMHEMAHLLHMDHSVRFWDQLTAWLPDARQLDKRLNEEGRIIMPLGHY